MKRRRKIRENPWNGLSKFEIAKRWPYKLPIIEHLIRDPYKLKLVAEMLAALKLKVKATNDGKWFDIVEA